jgi:hypothetical protein
LPISPDVGASDLGGAIAQQRALAFQVPQFLVYLPAFDLMKPVTIHPIRLSKSKEDKCLFFVVMLFDPRAAAATTRTTLVDGQR